MTRSSLDQIDAVVEAGGCVISAERSTVLATVQEAIRSGRSATFYLTKSQFDAVNEWYWTEQRRKTLAVDEVSTEERQRIEFELGVKDTGFLYSNRITCGNCGSVYGAFEFIQQGIREHGREMVESALTLANATVLRVNPSGVAICQNCAQTLRIVGGEPVPHYYRMEKYGCCAGGDALREAETKKV